MPRLAVTHRLGTDRSLYVGPFPNLEKARKAQKALARVFGLHTRVGDPLPNDVSRYRERVEVYRAFVEDRGEFFAGPLPPEDRAALDDVQARQRMVGAVLTRQNFVVLLPTQERRVAHFYAVLGGRLAFEQEFAADADVPAALRRVSESFARYQNAPLGRGDVEASTILAAWLRDRGREGIVLPFDTPDALTDQRRTPPARCAETKICSRPTSVSVTCFCCCVTPMISHGVGCGVPTRASRRRPTARSPGKRWAASTESMTTTLVC